MNKETKSTELSNDKALHIPVVSKLLLDEYPAEKSYSIRKLYSLDELNVKCSCPAPDGLISGGYCYAEDKKGNKVRPCQIGSGLIDLMQNADIKG